MSANAFLDAVKEAPEDSGLKARSQINLDIEQWKQVYQTIKRRNKKGIVLPFEAVREQVQSESTSLNNFVYQLKLKFKKHGIKLHAGMRHVKDPKTGKKRDYVAINIVGEQPEKAVPEAPKVQK